MLLRTVARVALRHVPTARRVVFYRRKHGRPPNLWRPRAFSEKVNWRMLKDRRDEIAWTCDKLAMKDHAERLGVAVAKTVWSGTDVRELAHISLPDRWVLKPNHSTALVHFGFRQPDIADLEQRTSGWLMEQRRRDAGEWAYGEARPLLLVEERLGGEEPPEDYKFFVFHGRPRVVQVDRCRFSRHTRRFYSLPQWDELGVLNSYPVGDPVPKPDQLSDMLRLASLLAQPWEFMRIDLYLVDGTVYFGETTPYPGAGLEPFEPREFDLQLGSYWQLPPLSSLKRSRPSRRPRSGVGWA